MDQMASTGKLHGCQDPVSTPGHVGILPGYGKLGTIPYVAAAEYVASILGDCQQMAGQDYSCLTTDQSGAALMGAQG